jgi:ankyrin repeat protein
MGLLNSWRRSDAESAKVENKAQAMSSQKALDQLLDKIGELPSFETIRPLTTNSRNCVGETPLHVAAVWGDVDAIELLMGAGADVNARGEFGHTPLHEASAQNKLEAVRVLMAWGADLVIKNDWGQTPREAAALAGNSEIEKELAPSV